MKRPNRHKSERQSRKDAVRRRAKALAKHAAQYRLWMDRPQRHMPPPRRAIGVIGGTGPSMARMLAANPDLMDRLFGPVHPLATYPTVANSPSTGDQS